MADCPGYAYLWDGSESSWVLGEFSPGDDVQRLLVFNVESKLALVIEDPETHAEVVRRMLSEGVPVVTEYPSC